jgi:hypothetical protein
MVPDKVSQSILTVTVLQGQSQSAVKPALAGSTAVEQHLGRTVRDYQTALEQAHDIALSAQALGHEVRRAGEALEAFAALPLARDACPYPLSFSVSRNQLA